MNKVRIAVDVMGGDEEPQVVLDGIDAALAADADLEVLAVGPADIVEPFAEERERVSALVAPDVITMEDDPIEAVMHKRKSSIVLACRAVKKGEAAGFFSAGATGAMTAAATAYVTPFKYLTDTGEKRPIRPCIVSTIPNRAGGETVFCDLGANPDVEPEDMVRFAQMGATYARIVCGIANPRIGLLSNGTEDTKGSHFTKSCFPLMKQKVKGFAGNCEGSDFTSGNFDVVVCDGFSGNVALKAIEGTAKLLLHELKGVLLGSMGGKVAALLIKKSLKGLQAKLSGDSRGGAVLLGLRGVVLIGHGATSVEAVKNGTLATAQAVRSNLVEMLAASMDNIVR
ncbi:phosphate acyltransferase PlsX [Collinsella ihumii]|uniref:Phosphate acyltransferase n=1 Tax=Collinsella ihumii TaxID=1720204 RepID=A0ABT7XF93_9ACTN|nr:phosphate acyltransferase PlsX [Collinsella ihumii]MBM6775893.1 phosphate acyltransferase PlsX [Collinsella tanakaei]MDN0054905.1 phosphate acyltransferase PlsX [Collinsella ihumii]MDN0064077.1 phosphate acyltransferase PlsX [Collinsella ihumii]